MLESAQNLRLVCRIPTARGLAVFALAGIGSVAEIACSRGPAEAGPPGFSGRATPLELRSRGEYDAESRRYEGAPRLARVPQDLTRQARFGMILCRDGTAVVAVDGRAPDYSVIVDVNGNGDLTDDPRKPLEAGATGTDGPDLRSAIFEGPGRRFKIATPASGPGVGTVLHYPATERRGSVRVSGRSVPFVIEGYCGRYDQPLAPVSFDLDSDGTADSAPLSDERFAIRDSHVVIDGKSYDFAVEPSGAWVRLTRSEKPHEPRVSLADGAPAPDFQFVDLAGRARRLADLRGRVVLLHFWATWSAPCWQEMPRIVELYSRFHGQGLEILGLAEEEVAYAVQAYVAKNKISWPQALQGRDGPVFRTYRVTDIPTTVLIDREGKIASKEPASGALAARIAALVSKESE